MRRAIAALGLSLLLVAVASTAAAQSAPPNPNRPAATLLLPYFEVDLDNAQGMTTLFTINNSSATAILAHVTLWSDLAFPVFSFNVYLTGYDVQTINVRDVLNGTVPRTASAGQDLARDTNQPTRSASPRTSTSHRAVGYFRRRPCPPSTFPICAPP